VRLKSGPRPPIQSSLGGMLLFAGGAVVALLLVDVIDFLNRPRHV
jgi:hypothetical protein